MPSTCFRDRSTLNRNDLKCLSHPDYDLKSRIFKSTKAFSQAQVDQFRQQNLHAIDTMLVDSPQNLVNIVQLYFDFFDEHIFFKALGASNPKICELTIVREGSPEWKANVESSKSLLGRTIRRSSKSGPTWHGDVWVKIYIFEFVGGGSIEDLTLQYIGTLLHEMVHALQFAYTCPCNKCKVLYKDAIGVDGHGITFKDIARTIQHTVRTRLGLDVNVLKIHRRVKHVFVRT